MVEGKKNLVVTIDEELHQRLKIHCAEQKTSIKDMIVKLINEELEQRGQVAVSFEGLHTWASLYNGRLSVKAEAANIRKAGTK